MKRIGIDWRPVSVQPVSGISKQVCAVLEALKTLPNFEVMLYSDGPINHPDRLVATFPAGGISLTQVVRPFRRLWFEHRFLPRILCQDQIDVFITTANCGVPAPLDCHMRRVAWVHDLFPITLKNQQPSLKASLHYQSYYHYAYRMAAWLADELWTPSQFTSKECERLFGEGVATKTQVLHNAVRNYAAIQPVNCHHLDLPPCYWLLVTSAEPRKNLPLFLHTWLELGDAVPTLVIVGPQGLVSAAKSKQAGTRLRLLTNLSEAELAAVYTGANRLWMPSIAEGFGLPVIEAMSAGTLVAIAKGSALDEIVPPNTPAFAAESPDELRQLMKKLAGHEPSQEEQTACMNWAHRFDSQAFRQRVLELAGSW
ncbi:MAG: glycosyltransferase family 4 protein [Candidatus Competibacteraceae bacterium]|nr:glycosyltransferase family 4 protein [Candidatus Competibacteraceae bacterium]